MSLQIANQRVIEKIEALARATGLSKTAAVERAVDRLLSEQHLEPPDAVWQEFDAILSQLDKIGDRRNARDVPEWDEHGLPR